MEENYNNIFELFSDKDKIRIFLNKPFKQYNYYIGINPYSLITLKSDLINLKYEQQDKPDCLKWINLLEKKYENKILFNVEDLKNQLIPELIDEYSEPEECEECNGEGYEECDLGHKHDCENCRGLGDIKFKTGKKISNGEKVYKILDFGVKSKYLEIIIKVSEILKINNISFYLNEETLTNPILFSIGDFNGLVMPYSLQNHTEYSEIKINN